MGKTFKTIEIIRPFVRNGAFPIDTTTLFYSYDDAAAYAHSDPNAYAGQIITIDDEDLQKVGVYIVDYDRTKTFNYVISPIETSNSNGSVLFNWKGAVATTEDLPNFSHQGDVYLVKNEHKFYVAYEQTDDSVLWSEMSMGIEYASYTKDGILTKEEYTALSNQTNKDAVLFSASDHNVKNNKWVEVQHTQTETAETMKIASVGAVKQIFSDMTKAQLPHIELESTIALNHYVDSLAIPKFKIHYYPEFGGLPSAINIYKIVNNNVDTTPIYSNTNLTIPEYDTVQQRYTYEYNTGTTISYDYKAKVEYKVVVQYNGSVDGNVLPGTTSETIAYNFYNAIQYGTNNFTKSEFYLGGKQEIELKYNPNDYQTKTTLMFIRVPATCVLTSVTYLAQHDEYAKELFTETLETINGIDYKKYTYALSDILPFKSPGIFIFYLN